MYNGSLEPSGKAILTADNRSLRFGDGCFETMRMAAGKIVLADYHFERLFASLRQLEFDVPASFTAAVAAAQIEHLAAENGHAAAARVRLTVFRGNGSLYAYENDLPNIVIQTWALQAQGFNSTGLITGIYTKARKTCDDFSHLKSNNFLPYAMAARWVKQQKLDDAIVLNTYGRVAEATMANVFLVSDGKIITPALSEGCIGGVMRRYLINCIRKEQIPFEETAVTTETLATAQEVFITNSIRSIVPVARCGTHTYRCQLSEYLYDRFVRSLPVTAG